MKKGEEVQEIGSENRFKKSVREIGSGNFGENPKKNLETHMHMQIRIPINSFRGLNASLFLVVVFSRCCQLLLSVVVVSRCRQFGGRWLIRRNFGRTSKGL